MSDGKYLPLYDTGIILREKSFQAIARMQWNTYDDSKRQNEKKLSTHTFKI